MELRGFEPLTPCLQSPEWTFLPGSKLALSIASLPIWITYLAGAIRAVRRGG